MKSYTYNFYYNGDNYTKMFGANSQAEADKQWAVWLEHNPRVIALTVEQKKFAEFTLQGDMAQQFNDAQDMQEEEEDFFEGY